MAATKTYSAPGTPLEARGQAPAFDDAAALAGDAAALRAALRRAQDERAAAVLAMHDEAADLRRQLAAKQALVDRLERHGEEAERAAAGTADAHRHLAAVKAELATSLAIRDAALEEAAAAAAQLASTRRENGELRQRVFDLTDALDAERVAATQLVRRAADAAATLNETRAALAAAEAQRQHHGRPGDAARRVASGRGDAGGDDDGAHAMPEAWDNDDDEEDDGVLPHDDGDCGDAPDDPEGGRGPVGPDKRPPGVGKLNLPALRIAPRATATPPVSARGELAPAALSDADANVWHDGPRRRRATRGSPDLGPADVGCSPDRAVPTPRPSAMALPAASVASRDSLSRRESVARPTPRNSTGAVRPPILPRGSDRPAVAAAPPVDVASASTQTDVEEVTVATPPPRYRPSTPPPTPPPAARAVADTGVQSSFALPATTAVTVQSEAHWWRTVLWEVLVVALLGLLLETAGWYFVGPASA